MLGEVNQFKKVNSKILTLCYVKFKISEDYKIQVSNGFKFVLVKLKIATCFKALKQKKINEYMEM